MDYLKDYYIKEEDIKYINKNYDENIINYIIYSKKNIVSILKYLISLNIDVRNVIYNRIDLIFMSLNSINQNFSKLDKKMISFIINNSIDDLINFNI